MIELTRTVRFCINSPSESGASTGHNTFAGEPSLLGSGLGRYSEMDVRCRGEIDERTGYFVNIKEIDRAVRQTAVPLLERACEGDTSTDVVKLVRDVAEAVNEELGGCVRGVRWWLTPFYSLEVDPMKGERVLMRQQFDFAAAHRLHCPHLSEAENRELFGKCNNPRGHGHNYRVEPCVELAAGDDARPAFTLQDLERVTAGTIIERFDHTHLNEDTAEFNVEQGGLNPSVENIAKVCYGLLKPALEGEFGDKGVALRSITVWETDKTSCTFPAGA